MIFKYASFSEIQQVTLLKTHMQNTSRDAAVQLIFSGENDLIDKQYLLRHSGCCKHTPICGSECLDKEPSYKFKHTNSSIVLI